MLDALTSDALKPIIVPEGKFAAPGDFRIQNVFMRLTNRSENVPLIRQTQTGNCAEYTALNTAIVLSKFGIDVNASVLQYIQGRDDLNLPTVENNLTNPLVLNAQEKFKTKEMNGKLLPFPVQMSDIDNLDQKSTNPYEPLSNTNSALLFREVVSPKNIVFDPSDFATFWSDATGQKLIEREVQAILIGSGDHATSLLKLGGRFISIDPYSTDIVRELTLHRARFLLTQALSRPHSFITFNDVRMK